MWQLGDVHEKLGNNAKAQEWFSLLVTSPKGRQTDPGVLARIANLFNKNGDETQAFHYNLEAHKYWPVDMNVITWLGIYYVKQEMYEAAMPFFDRAAQIEPKEVKWRLMVASCWRRMGDFSRALKVYEDIHQKHPNDIECVRYLITICKEMGLKYDHYAMHLRKLERIADQQMQQQQQHQATMSHPGATDGFAGYGGEDDMNGGMDLPGPGQSEQYDDASAGGNGILSGPTELYEAADPELKKKTGPKKRIAPKRQDDDDNDWGNDELDDELLPM
jgi:intraflagellar transport protein 88